MPDVVNWFAGQCRAAYSLLKPVATSVRGKINQAELQRVLILALSSGSLPMLIQVLTNNVGSIFDDPATGVAVSGWVTIVVAMLDLYRRINHGGPVPVVNPAQKRASS